MKALSDQDIMHERNFKFKSTTSEGSQHKSHIGLAGNYYETYFLTSRYNSWHGALEGHED